MGLVPGEGGGGDVYCSRFEAEGREREEEMARAAASAEQVMVAFVKGMIGGVALGCWCPFSVRKPRLLCSFG